MPATPRRGRWRRAGAIVVAGAMATASAAAAVDVDALWDFGNPAVSEQRLRAAQATASPDDVLILQTQIARSHGLRGDFAQAQATLDAMQLQLAGASDEVRVRHALESGRTLSSATHPPASQTPEVKARARREFLRAHALAREARLDGLAVDALHMMVFVDTDPAAQLAWNQQALALVEASSQPAAKQWEASLRNNLGVALHELKRYDEALAQFQQAVVLRERRKDAEATRIAYWMVAWTLRAQGRVDDALAIQLRLEREGDAAGAPDPYVFEELELLYRALGDEPRAQHYAARRRAAAG